MELVGTLNDSGNERPRTEGQLYSVQVFVQL